MTNGINSPGFFQPTGGDKIGLDGTCHCSVRHGNQPLSLTGWNRVSARLYQHGQNRNDIEVVGSVQRYNLGDAEWYGYQTLLSLSESLSGNLTIGGPTWLAYGACFWVSGEIEVGSGTSDGSDIGWCHYRHLFIQSAREKPEDLANWHPTLPAAVAEYADRSNERIYSFAGSQIGICSDEGLKIRMWREPIIRTVPRAYGIQVLDIVQGRQVEISCSAAADVNTYPARWQVEEWLHEFVNNFGDAPGSLTGNGNTFADCHMLSGALSGSGQWDHYGGTALQFSVAEDLS